ncbi:MAG: hypothetical protein H6722_15120 [Sandaracinus sp.]|nr:hypothetical protein [Sandaracinus sp.]
MSLPRSWILLSIFFAACGSSSPAPTPECETSADCAGGLVCLDGSCRAPSDSGMHRDAGLDAGSCAPGQLTRAGGCLDECAHPDALPCGEGTVCDVGTGTCVASGTPGVLTGADVSCGTATCRAGTECTVDDVCEPIPACGRMVCTDDGAVCWGRSCVFERPTGGCTPPTLERLNQDDFLLGGDGGAFDLEFDDACNAYAATMISGTDYLRQLAPDGTLTVWDGVTNLNMGEVAVLRAIGGEFGSDDDPGEVALTYVCCASCGCVGADPQGVARLDRAGEVSLPMVVEATPSTGTAPWGSATLDTGPTGSRGDATARSTSATSRRTETSCARASRTEPRRSCIASSHASSRRTSSDAARCSSRSKAARSGWRRRPRRAAVRSRRSKAR